MLVDKTRFVLCGDITSRTHRASSSLLTPTIVTVLSRLVRSCSACSTRMNSGMLFSWSLPTSRICQYGPQSPRNPQHECSNTDSRQNAMNAAEITDKLGLHSLRQRAWVSRYASDLAFSNPLTTLLVHSIHLRHFRRRSLRGSRMVEQFAPQGWSPVNVTHTHHVKTNARNRETFLASFIPASHVSVASCPSHILFSNISQIGLVQRMWWWWWW